MQTFETSRLLVRPICEEDAEAYEANFADFEIIRHFAKSVPWPYPKGNARCHIVSEIIPNLGKNRWTWCLFLKTDPLLLIGAIDLWRPGHPENRSFWLGKEYWGRGLMTEAVIPTTDYAFDKIGFDVLILSNAAGNTRSRRIKEKAGARFLRNEPMDFNDPSFTHSEIWELSCAAWRTARKRLVDLQ